MYDDRIEINTTADLALAADRLSGEMDIKKVYTADDDSVNGVGCGSPQTTAFIFIVFRSFINKK